MNMKIVKSENLTATAVARSRIGIILSVDFDKKENEHG